MAQISRVYKVEIPILIRILCKNYNHQRCEYSYYDVLRVSPNASQKEIKDAYIKLSKQMHPDCSNTGNHADFLKINEAYSFLSKKENRYCYDNGLKYNKVHRHTGFDSNYNHWDVYNFYNLKPKRKVPKEARIKVIKFVAINLIIGIILQIMFVKNLAEYKKRVALNNSAKIQLRYERAKEENKDKTFDEHLQRYENWNKKYN